MPTLTLASWNVNSLKVRLPQVIHWLQTTTTDALVLQETKLTDEAFPLSDFDNAGFDVVFSGQKTYNGVALITRRETMLAPTRVDCNMPGYPDEQKRLIAADLFPKESSQAVRFIGGYFPNGMTPGSRKYLYKLDWLRALSLYLQQSLQENPRLVLGGDFNIAPDDRDVWDPIGWKNRILVSPPERAALAQLIALGLTDSFRVFHEENERFSWWDYRMKGFEQNHGLRIDHLLVSDALLPALKAADIDVTPRSNPQPSDHAPVTATFDY